MSYDENDVIKQLTEMMDDGKMALAGSQMIEDTDFGDLTPEKWEEIQLMNRMFLSKAATFMIMSARGGAAISDDPNVKAAFSEGLVDKLVDIGIVEQTKGDDA
jgi:hypothetical protein